MVSRVLISLQRVAKQAICVLLGVVICFGLMQSTAQAAVSTDMAGEPEISPARLEQMRAERRKEQSEASQAAAASAEQENDSLGDKLNLDEIVEDNALTGGNPNAANMRNTSR